jgi:hypothetical protein
VERYAHESKIMEFADYLRITKDFTSAMDFADYLKIAGNVPGEIDHTTYVEYADSIYHLTSNLIGFKLGICYARFSTQLRKLSPKEPILNLFDGTHQCGNCWIPLLRKYDISTKYTTSVSFASDEKKRAREEEPASHVIKLDSKHVEPVELDHAILVQTYVAEVSHKVYYLLLKSKVKPEVWNWFYTQHQDRTDEPARQGSYFDKVHETEPKWNPRETLEPIYTDKVNDILSTNKVVLDKVCHYCFYD